MDGSTGASQGQLHVPFVPIKAKKYDLISDRLIEFVDNKD